MQLELPDFGDVPKNSWKDGRISTEFFVLLSSIPKSNLDPEETEKALWKLTPI
jgi:hypothetical protein